MKVLKNFAIILLSVSIATPVFAGDKKGKIKLPSLNKSFVEVTGEFDGNRVRNDMENNGQIVSSFSGHSGMEWPKDNHTYSVYSSSIWFAGKVNGEIRTAAGDYSSEMMPGPWGSDPGAAEHKFYKVSKSDLADPLNNEDFQNWPTDLGAPWVDVDGDGVYSPLPGGPDHPEFVGDQVLWYVANDGAPGSHGLFGTLPLGLEVQFTMFGFDRPDVFGDMMFVKGLAINKGGNTIEDMFIGLWSDPDMGDAGDDFVGCDTTLSLGFVWNDGVDSEYASYSGGTPAVGYDFFQGPMVESAGDTALFMGQKKPGYKNLPMSSFVKYINPDAVYFDPNDATEVYNYMLGLRADGTPFPDEVTGGSKFVHPGDPASDTGPNDTEYVDSDVHASSDRRFVMNAGPFTMAPGDSQEVVFGIMHAAAGSAKKSVTYLRQVDALAQLAYDIQFALPASPSAPTVTAVTFPEEIIFTWDDASESYMIEDVIDKVPVASSFDTTFATGYFSAGELAVLLDGYTVLDTSYADADSSAIYTVQYVAAIDTSFLGENTFFKFEGYNVYQLETLSGTGAKKRIATYDLKNGITEIYDNVFSASLGEIINMRTQFGSDSGIKRSLSVTKDALNDGIPLKTNRQYYFAVTAYGYNPFGIPKTLESSLSIMALRPQYPEGVLTDSLTASGTITSGTHTSGASDGSVKASVVVSTAITGEDYVVTFSDTLPDGTKVINWSVSSGGAVVSPNNTIQGGVDFTTAKPVGTGANPIIDGLLFEVNGPPLEFKDFYVTHNAAGAIVGNAGAAADYYGYPGMGRGNIAAQQTNGSTWFITTSNTSNTAYENFYPYITRYTAGYGNPNGGIQHLIPDDYEFRFTENGGKMWDDENGVFIDVSMEVWNIGVASDPADDFQMMPMYWDPDGNGVWDLAVGDHSISGGTNDPYMEGFYVLEHHLQESATFDADGDEKITETDTLEYGPRAGYFAIIAALTADPSSNSATGGYIWASSPNYLGAPGQITSVTLLNMTFANWNGGDVGHATFPDNVDAASPEIGTVFRMVTTKPNNASDVFTLKTGHMKPQAKVVQVADVNVWPNPYFGYNPEERNPIDQQMHFTHLPESGSWKIRIFDLAGNHIRTLDGSSVGDGTQFSVWDLRNDFGVPVASGMYIAHVESGSNSKILKLAVVQPEQRLDRY
jgi:hypothetical protein